MLTAPAAELILIPPAVKFAPMVFDKVELASHNKRSAVVGAPAGFQAAARLRLSVVAVRVRSTA